MMFKACVFIAAALGAAGAASAQVEANFSLPSTAPKPAELSKEQADKIIAQCSTRKFESAAEYEVDGSKRRTAVRMCAAVGETDAQWIQRLEKTAAAVEARAGLPEEAKTKLLIDLGAEIARLRVLMPGQPASAGTIAGIAPSRPAAPTLLGRPAPKAGPLTAADALVATVPPMPAPLPPQKDLPIGTVPPSMLVQPPPLSITCLEQGERGEGLPCRTIRAGMVLAVKADADLKGPATLRFLRRDRPRGEVDIGALKQGQLVEVKLPPAVCAGVVRSELSIEVVRTGSAAARSAATKGPYDLRC